VLAIQSVERFVMFGVGLPKKDSLLIGARRELCTAMAEDAFRDRACGFADPA